MSRIILPESVVINTPDGRSLVATNGHPNYPAIRRACLAGDETKAISLMDVSQAITRATAGTKVEVRNGEVLFEGQPLRNPACDALLDIVREASYSGVQPDITPLTNFLGLLMKNPSYRAVNELWGFIEATKLTILPDGRFVAFKKVRRNGSGLADCYSGNFNNSIGAKPRVNRNEVDEDPNRTCSKGLHVCSESYLAHYGGDVTVVVAVSPEDVVAVPTDYNAAKMRTCGYEVLRERNGDLNSNVNEFRRPVYTGTGQDELDLDWEDADPVDNAPDYGVVVTDSEAISILGLGDCDEPRDALRRRCLRGVACERVGVDRVRVFDSYCV